MSVTYITDRESYLCAELQKRDLALADTIALCTHLVGQRDKAKQAEYVANHNRNEAVQRANAADKRCMELIAINRKLLGVQ